MDDLDLPDTRVFVSGLPPNYTSEQLGAHFAGRYQVTDAVVVPGRRIGFVGFRNYSLAKNAVKYFDKSYIRMSKISVQLAKPVDFSRDEESTAVDISTSTVTSAATSKAFKSYVPIVQTFESNKRKRDSNETEKHVEDSQLAQYMKTMKPTSASTWTNGDGSFPARNSKNDLGKQLEEDTAELELTEKARKKEKRAKDKREQKSVGKNAETNSVIVVEIKGDQSAQRMKKKSKITDSGLVLPDTTGAVTAASTIHDESKEERRERKRAKKEMKKEKKEEKNLKASSETQENGKGGVNFLDEDAFRAKEEGADGAQGNETKSDTDWLRAKTSRLLDLVEVNSSGTRPASTTKDQSHEAYSSPESEEDGEQRSTAPSTLKASGQEALRVPNGRLFVRNLSYTTTETELETTFAKFGTVSEVHVVRDPKSFTSKGLAYVQYIEPDAAEDALKALDGKSFQGRLIHILPASDKRKHTLSEFEISKLPLKQQKALKRKSEATTSTFSWNSMYMNPDAVVSSIADRLGVAKSQVIDPTSSDAAVKQAHAETNIIKETKAFLSSNGVNVEAFKNRERDGQVLLLKNFAYGTTSSELSSMLEPFGQIDKLLMPPSGTIALVRYEESTAARRALKQLAYHNLKGSVLFLEKGPKGLFDSSPDNKANISSATGILTQLQDVDLASYNTAEGASSTTLFIRNLNFATTSARLTEVFKPLAGFLSAKVNTRIDPKRPGEILSRGYGFAEFASKPQADAAMSVMNGFSLDQHQLQIRASHKATDAAVERRREDSLKKSQLKKTKIIIKNLPFEASTKDIKALFGAYGQLRTVRVPRKFDNSTRGFAFADFVTAKEAESAMDALANTHLLGRRLVLEFAAGETLDPEEEIKAMERKVGQQTDMIHLSKITGSARQKFNVDAGDELE